MFIHVHYIALFIFDLFSLDNLTLKVDVIINIVTYGSVGMNPFTVISVAPLPQIITMFE